MRSIFSYDVILDAIRLVVGRGHVDFVETLAEEVASVLLQHARVRSIRVSIRKLGVIEGEVGIEIQRDRASGSAQDGSRGADEPCSRHRLEQSRLRSAPGVDRGPPQFRASIAMRIKSMAERAPSFCLSWVQLLAIVL